ncbi:protocatechuate 3,4-dioxygenase [Erythrobacter sp. SG61-1L]|uniref:gallate dioxygenase n=1 Tax=Erythrobacter sp. SG61-1L TaxID=1603897 RepID=UPI0006C93ACF|nr:gallate dioxygenase [Erythrobacter sp. SG61-1L]KPL68545.1 protocatechuate 3,4-dioxygenase [Erythrobacter sp. SG61-1L]
MAEIVGGFAVSHTPTIAFAHDAGKYDDPVWKPIFEGFEPVKQWLAEKKPDVILYIYNDHMTSFWMRHYSHFALGIGEEYAAADEGGGPRNIPPIKGDPELAQHIAFGMVADDFDLSYWQGMGLDHGAFSPLSVLLPYDDENGWPVKIVPLQCGVLELPIPRAKRFWNFGRSLRRAIQSYPKDIKVAIAGTGGLSHQVHGERCGFNNVEWDMEFMDRLHKDPESLIDIPVGELVKLGGMEGAEIVMWMLMRGALAPKVNKLHQSFFLPSMTSIASMIFEDAEPDPLPMTKEEYAARMMADVAPALGLEGTYPFTVGVSARAWRINNFLHTIVEPGFRERFRTDFEGLAAEYKLTEEEKRMIRELDWIGMIHYGVIFFNLEKLAPVVGLGNIDVYAAMKGMSVPDFQKTRNAAINYSVEANPN